MEYRFSEQIGIKSLLNMDEVCIIKDVCRSTNDQHQFMNKQSMIHLFMKELLMYNDPIFVNFSQYVTKSEYRH